MKDGAPDLLGRPRYRVRWRPEGGGRLRGIETLGGEPPLYRELDVPGEVLVFARQKDGDVEVVSWGLVEDVVIEQQDRYGDWHRIGEWTPEQKER